MKIRKKKAIPISKIQALFQLSLSPSTASPPSVQPTNTTNYSELKNQLPLKSPVLQQILGVESPQPTISELPIPTTKTEISLT